MQLGEQERRRQEPDRRRRAHVAQLAGWAIAGLILVAAAAGLAGPGPLSRTTVSSPLVEVEYERFVRRLGDTSLTVRVRADPAEPGTARLWISGDYVARLNVRQVVPQPGSWTAVRDGVVLAFPAPDGRARISVRVSPDHIGLLRGEIGVPNRPPVGVRQFVYP